ncbi:3578_t:CDS:2, partial [Rhizophagus irregularis]
MGWYQDILPKAISPKNNLWPELFIILHNGFLVADFHNIKPTLTLPKIIMMLESSLVTSDDQSIAND